jgi:hypothetical protein
MIVVTHFVHGGRRYLDSSFKLVGFLMDATRTPAVSRCTGTGNTDMQCNNV